jgi:hypothetical protein
MGNQRSRRDEDANYRWAFRYCYKRDPSPDELEAYKHALHIERLRSFPRHWLSEQDIADLRAAGDVIEDAVPTVPAPSAPAQSPPPPETSPSLASASVPAVPAANGAAAKRHDQSRRRGGGYPRGAPARAGAIARTARQRAKTGGADRGACRGTRYSAT